MDFFHGIELGDNAPDEINVVVENCKGSYNKLEYDREKFVFRLDRVLYSPVYWSFEYGFVPQTWEGDDDPLDIGVLITNPTFPGCIIRARPIGVLKMQDENGIDNKIISVAIKDPVFAHDHAYTTIKDIPPHTLREIKEFFEIYKRLEPKKWVKFKAWEGATEAKKIILEAAKAYKKKFKH
ncbi:MAG TPA: inorganic diphosphatase [archaeon]|nr:inorganic diphosphatase [archaeon]